MERYSRQIDTTLLTPEQQKLLTKSRVAIIGVGGLGATVATALALAGVGTITLIDGDTVALSNLNRQILYSIEDIGQSKAIRAAAHLTAKNNEIHIEPHHTFLSDANSQELLAPHDLVIDCLDNWPDRYIVNKQLVRLHKNFIHGAVESWQGQFFLHRDELDPCMACLFPRSSIERSPNLAATPLIIGGMMAGAALQWLTGTFTSTGTLVTWNGMRNETRPLHITRNPQCPHCGDHNIKE